MALSLLPQWNKLREAGLDFVFPKRCLGCNREGSFLCSDCVREPPCLGGFICPRCGLPPKDTGVSCPHCLSRQFHTEGIGSPFRYEGLLGRAINQFKYGNLRALCNTLALFLYQYMEEKKLKAALLMAVPLHTGRLKSVAIINHNC